MASNNKEIDLNWIKHNARTGDIILCSGKSIFSLLIKVATFSSWSHVGVIVRLKRENQDLSIIDQVYVLQSIIHSEDDMKDVLQRDLVSSGVQVNKIEDVIRVEEGKLYYRQLLDMGKFKLRPIKKDNKKFLEEAAQKPYETDLFQLVNSVTGINLYHDPSSYFCSEIVADFYYHMKFATMENNTYPNNFTPASFGEDPAYPIKLEPGYKFGEIYKVLPLSVVIQPVASKFTIMSKYK